LKPVLEYPNQQTTKKTLKIGIDGRVLQDPKPSGITQYALNIIKGIAALDQKNQYIIFYNSFRKIENTIPYFGSNFQNRIYHFPNKILEWLWKIFPYPKIDKKLKVDIFFSPHFINIPLSKKVKKIVTIHDLSFRKNKNFFSWRKNLWHWQMNPKKICKNFDKIITVSHHTKKDLINIYKIPSEKIKVIYNGAYKITTDFSCNPEKEKSFLAQLNLSKKNYIFCLATLEPRKNISSLIDAFYLIQNRIPEKKLVITGKKGWLYNIIFKKIKKYNLQGKVVFTGFLNEEKKHFLFKNCSVFVFPSFYEGFGIPIIEAVNYKIPIITSSVSSIPEIISDAAILINPHNVNDIARAILEVVNNERVKDILRQKEKNMKEYSWTTAAKQTSECILN